MSPPTLADAVAKFEDALEPILETYGAADAAQDREADAARAAWSTIKSWLDLGEAAT